MLADLLTISVVFFGLVLGYKAIGIGDYSVRQYLFYAVPLFSAFVCVNVFLRLYHGNPFYPSLPVPPVEEFRRLVGSSIIVHIVAMSVMGFRHEAEWVSRFVLIASALLTAGLAQPVRDLSRRLLAKFALGRIHAVIVGDNVAARRLIGYFASSEYFGIYPHVFDGDNHDIVKFAQERDIKLLITLQDPRLIREEMVEFVKWFQYIVNFPSADTFPIFGARAIIVGDVGGFELVNQRRIKGLMVEKRLVDSALSVLIALVALPFILIMPILIKLSSKGPVIYKARRLGKNGRTIYVWKFRSMYADADKRLQAILDSDPSLKAEFERDFKLKNDPRVTPLGKFMRKTSIDELPQLWNVLCGEMALVGPRPIVEKEIPYYGSDYDIFSLVKPGITGLWQATGRSDTDYAQRVALDKYYVLNWSPWMDLWIVFRTVLAVLKMKGSY